MAELCGGALWQICAEVHHGRTVRWCIMAEGQKCSQSTRVRDVTGGKCARGHMPQKVTQVAPQGGVTDAFHADFTGPNYCTSALTSTSLVQVESARVRVPR